MRSFDDICRELRKHPDFLGACVWQRADIDGIIEDIGDVEWNMSADEIFAKINMKAWESLACEDGFDMLYDAVAFLGAYTEKEDN